MNAGMKYRLFVRSLTAGEARLAVWGLVWLGGVILSGLLGQHTAVFAQPTPPAQMDALLNVAEKYGRVRVIVRLEPDALFAAQALDQAAVLDAAQTTVLSQLAGTEARLTAAYDFIPFMALEVDAAALELLAGMSLVSAIEEDVPAPPSLSSSIPLIAADQAWQAGYTGAGQTVAILDTGVDNAHPAFTTGGNRLVAEACYSTTSATYGSISLCPNQAAVSTAPGSADDCVDETAGYNVAQRDCEHGTHVAGIAAGNDGQMAGVAKEANIIAIQIYSLFTNRTWCGYSNCLLSFTSDQISGLERVYELRETYDIAAVNMSLGNGRYTEICDAREYGRKAAIDKLREAGIVTIVAAGNNGYQDALSAPACISSAVSVGATDNQDKVASFSNRADFLDLFAPGTDIEAPIPGGTAVKQGSSMAAPHVTGAWAIIRQAHPDASVNQILAIMKQNGEPVSDAHGVASAPRLNVAQVVDANFSDNVSYQLYLPAVLRREPGD